MFMGMNAIVDQIAQDITTTMRDREEKEGMYFRLERRKDHAGSGEVYQHSFCIPPYVNLTSFPLV